MNEKPKEFWMEGLVGEIGLANVTQEMYKTVLKVECLNGNPSPSNHSWDIYGSHGLQAGDKVLYYKESEHMLQPHHLFRVTNRTPLDRLRSGIGYGRVVDDEAPEAFKLVVEWINRKPVQLSEEERTLTFSRNFVHRMTNIRYGMPVLILLESGGDQNGISVRFVVEAGRGDCMED